MHARRNTFLIGLKKWILPLHGTSAVPHSLRFRHCRFLQCGSISHRTRSYTVWFIQSIGSEQFAVELFALVSLHVYWTLFITGSQISLRGIFLVGSSYFILPTSSYKSSWFLQEQKGTQSLHRFGLRFTWHHPFAHELCKPSNLVFKHKQLCEKDV